MGRLTARLRAFLGSRRGLLFKVSVSLGILTWFALRIDFAALAQLLADGRPAYLFALIGLSLARTAIGVFRFRILTNLLKPISVVELFKQKFIAAYFNNFLPTALGGDAVRIFMLGDCGIPKQQGAVLILIERLMGFSALILLAAFGALTFDVPTNIELAIFALALGFAVAVTAFLAGRTIFDSFAGRSPVLQRAWQALALLAESKTALLIVFGISIVFQIATISLTWLVAQALSIELPFAACLALVPLVYVATMLPVSLGGVGLREASFAYLLGLLGLPLEVSLLISLGTYAALLPNGLVGAAISLFGNLSDPRTRTDRSAPADQEPVQQTR